MRNVLFSLLVFMVAGTAIFAQQVPRENVVVEIGTATW